MTFGVNFTTKFINLQKIYPMNEVNETNVSYAFSDDRNLLSLIEAVRNGIKYLNFSKIVGNSPFSLQDWSQFLHLSERTMQRYKKEKKDFNPIHSEKIIEITLIYKMGVEVFGDQKRFNVWLETKNIALGGITPKSLLDSTFGIQLIRDELLRIEQGVL